MANNRIPLRGFDQRHSLYNQMQSTIADVFDWVYTLESRGMVNESFRIASKRNHLLDSFQILHDTKQQKTHLLCGSNKLFAETCLYTSVYVRCVLHTWADIESFGGSILLADFNLYWKKNSNTYLASHTSFRNGGRFDFLGPFFLWISSQSSVLPLCIMLHHSPIKR